jgi:hypothetical protein
MIVPLVCYDDELKPIVKKNKIIIIVGQYQREENGFCVIHLSSFICYNRPATIIHELLHHFTSYLTRKDSKLPNKYTKYLDNLIDKYDTFNW